MLVRIRLERPTLPSIRWSTVALATAAVMTPSALVAFTLAFWAVASDLKWTGEFFLNHGLFSHWQVWLFTAAVLLFVARLLDRLVLPPAGYSLKDQRVPSIVSRTNCM